MRRSLTRLPRFGFILVCFFCLAAVHLTHAQDTMVLPQGQVGKAYSAQVDTEGGMPPLTWQLISGELPPGLHLSSGGKIEGTPTAARHEPFVFEFPCPILHSQHRRPCSVLRS